MVLSIHHPRYIQLRQQMRSMRKSAGLTQTQIAENLDLDQSYISKIERGERYVDMLFYLDWCEACNVAPEKAVMKLKGFKSEFDI